MIQNIISEAWNFLKSADFTAIVSSVLLAWNGIIYPAIKPFISARLQVKLETALAKVKQYQGVISELQKDRDFVVQKYNETVEYFEKREEMITAELHSFGDVLKTFANNSNMYAQDKLAVDNMINDARKIMMPSKMQTFELPQVKIEVPADIELPEEVIPLKVTPTVPTASETKKVDTSQVQIVD
jgi:uncharacterized membrane-anchored protein YhcB (DUF1043 family)